MRKPPEVSVHGLQSAGEAAARVAARCCIARIDKHTLESWRAEAAQRSLYVLDVRSPEEYQAGHLRGAHSAPGGQLVQETDSNMPTWGARVVLVDDNGIRDHDCVVAATNGLAGYCGSGCSAGRWRLGNRTL
jgi:3-mercaptopyruvate sulfurtransferase SseA